MTTNGTEVPSQNGTHVGQKPLNRADEVDDLLNAVQSLLIPFIRAADDDAATKHLGSGQSASGERSRANLLDYHEPEKLLRLLNTQLPQEGKGKDGLLGTVEQVLKYSVNTWDQGFLDKLYGSTNAVGVISELLLAVLNTNVHVYQVSPALTVIEKTTTRQLASLFGFSGPRAGGISTQGGSASNTTSIIIARNTLYPETKSAGNGNHRFVLFTSAHGHYSLEKAAQMCGMGSKNVRSVPIDSSGRMIPSALDSLITTAKEAGETPFYVNATAGTTVLGSFDPFEEIATICKQHGLWMHIDGSWGGSVAFSPSQSHKLTGAHLANSIAVNPHKMLGVPMTCSFLLTPDISIFHRANTLPAGYLFHQDQAEDSEVWDLADLTLQCGRRGDSLKLALAWIFYGASGFATQIDNAFSVATYMATQIAAREDFILISENPPPCLQVCFYHALGGQLGSKEEVTRRTGKMAAQLIRRGFMVDYAPGEKGSFFRVVINLQTRRETVDGLVLALEEIGRGS